MRPVAPIPPVPGPGEALFLDFDGTLVGIAPRPDAIVLPPGLGALLADLHGRLGGAVAIVSGRSLDDLRARLAGFPGRIAGSHGGEIEGLAADPAGPDPALVASLHAAARRAAATAGLLLEPKAQGAAFHYRHRPALAAAARRRAAALAAAFPGFAVQSARMAVEVRPARVSKERALERLMALAPYAGRRPVYAGDDATDEAALAWVARRGGIAVRVGAGASVAPWRLADPAAVLAWLGGTEG
ncbi:MAG: trehalose-phosphatase [Rhodobacteraceae bacterium]|nr:trehalose-phosphatase [Paracoccaceae bacterium]